MTNPPFIFDILLPAEEMTKSAPDRLSDSEFFKMVEEVPEFKICQEMSLTISQLNAPLIHLPQLWDEYLKLHPSLIQRASFCVKGLTELDNQYREARAKALVDLYAIYRINSMSINTPFNAVNETLDEGEPGNAITQ